MKPTLHRRRVGRTALPFLFACIAAHPVDAAGTEFRRGIHDGFERIVFEADAPLSAELVAENDRLRIRFENEQTFLAEGGARGTGELLRGLRIIDERTVELELAPGARFRRLRLDADKLGIDILPSARVALPLDPPEPESVPEAAPESANDGSAQVERTAAAGMAGAERPDDGQDEGYRRDLMIRSLLARIEALEGMTPGAGPGLPVPTGDREDGGSVREDLIIDRALERTLAGIGTLLLPSGAIEVEPSLAYALNDDATPVFITDIDDVSLFVGANRQRRQSVSAVTAIRAGLPFDSQIELELPWHWTDERIVTEVGNAGAAENDEQGSGMGDLRIGVAKTLYRGEDRLPDFVGRLFWDTASGEREDNSVGLGGGRNEFGASLSFLKRQDPLAFTGGVSVETSLEDNNVQQGDRLGVSVGAVLAASPHTSLKIGYTHRFEKKAEFDGNGIPGSSRTFGILSLGAAAVVARRTLVDFTIGVGLGDDAPDVTARLAVPIRFTLD
ncbi:MAG: transporter [Geminicoccaceae bacterium]